MSGNDKRDDAHSLERLVFFSDAVFAIILTLLVLELKTPLDAGETGLFHALAKITSHFIAFGLSFAIVSVFWLAHLSTLRRMLHFDWLVAVLNLFLLFTIALIPFACALLGEYGQTGQAWQVYCVLMIVASVAQGVLVIGMSRGKGRLIGGITAADFQHRFTRALSPGIVFAIGLLLNLAGHAVLSALCWVLLFPVMLIARLIFNLRTRTRVAKAG